MEKGKSGRKKANARNEMEGYSAGDSRDFTSNGNSGHGGLAGRSSERNIAENDERESPPHRKVSLTNADYEQRHSDRAEEAVSNRVLMPKDDAHCISLGNISYNGANQKMTVIFAGTEE